MKAKHKYNRNIREGARRIAQSYGYKTSIYDMPHMIQLMARAGIYLQDVDYEAKDNIVVDVPLTQSEHIADTEILKF